MKLHYLGPLIFGVIAVALAALSLTPAIRPNCTCRVPVVRVRVMRIAATAKM